MLEDTYLPADSPADGPESPVDGRLHDATPRARGPEDLGSVAIVHDYLNQHGGAERVVLALAGLWPNAPIYTSLYRADSTFPAFGAADVHTSPLHWLPVDRGFRNLFPLYPAAFRALGPLEYDVVISSSSGWAHSVRTAPRTFHVVYCHAPARWLYGRHHLTDARPLALRPLMGPLRSWDRTAARRADLYIANSREVRARIRRQYGIDPAVVYPPVDLERFSPSERGERLLVVSRLLPYKRVDAIVKAATHAGLGLDVVGVGPALEDLRRQAGPTVEFHGHATDEHVAELIEGCRALCVPGREDFGITSVEANAAGKPVIALAAGGALETVEDGVNGVFFGSHHLEEVLDAIRRCDGLETHPEAIAASARRFSRASFEVGLLTAIEEGLETRRRRFGPRRPGPQKAESMSPELLTPPAHKTLMLGKGWFPEQLGGLDRYYRDLFEHLPEASGIVIGRSAAVPDRAVGISDHDKPLPSRLFAFWLAGQHMAGKTDVVDAHFALYALAPLLLGRLRRTPAIVHFHGPWADESVAAGRRSALAHAIRRRMERAVYRRADEAVVLTSAFRQVLVERYGVAPWKVSVEHPGVDLDRFTPEGREAARTALGVGPDEFVAIAVRRLVPRMGLELLVDAWSQAADDLPPGSRLLIAGDGPLREKLLITIDALGVGGSVRLLGRVSDERLVELYRAADIAVIPTLECEGFGLVALEAAACGTPSVVTAVDGLPEAVVGLDPSLIVPRGDCAALRDRLLRARTERPSRSATRAHAERFGWAAVAERHRDIIRRAAARSRPHDRVRVVYLDHVARLSGGEIALLRLLPHLDKVNPHVILAEDGPLVGALHLAGVSTEVLPFDESARDVRKSDVNGRGVSPRVAATTATYILRLARRLRQLRPDLVHTNSLKAGVYGSLAAHLAGVPVVWHVRDRIADDYLPGPAVRLVRGMSHHLADAVVANSRCTLETLGTRRPSSMVAYSVLPEVMADAPPRRRQTGATLTFGIASRLAPWKGQDLFLRAFAAAFPRGAERGVIVGAALFGEDEYARSLERLIDELGLRDRVELRGHRTDVWDELSRIDVLVQASCIPEPFGQVVLEGMAAGVPVIAARAGGPAEILEHDVTGLLYELASVDGLAHAMQRMSDPALRSRLSAAARNGLARYAPNVVAAELQELYTMLVARAGRRR